jgi:hypothetical protein
VPSPNEDDEKDPWEDNQKWNTRTNTPTKWSATSSIWKTFKWLGMDNPKIKDCYTHVCTIAGCKSPFVKLNKAKGRDNWLMSKANDHLWKEHKTAPENGANVERDSKASVSLMHGTSVALQHCLFLFKSFVMQTPL